MIHLQGSTGIDEGNMKIRESAQKHAEEFLIKCEQFRLGELVTESSHPVTTNLSGVAREDIPAALDLLFQVDGDVVDKYREWVHSGRSQEIADTVVSALVAGGRIFFTGCGATGRLSILLDSIWRGYWQNLHIQGESYAQDWDNRTVSLMAGGDFALIKSVEGFEDITEFGKRQIEDAGVGPKDVVFAITEGGETSWVIGTAWKALEMGAKVYFVYNNPDDILRERVERSREIIDDPRIEKINLTTGPMAITGSTRMQATSIQLCVLVTILEMSLRGLIRRIDTRIYRYEVGVVPEEFLAALEELVSSLRYEAVLSQLAELVNMEELVYRNGGKVNYYADQLAVDVLTDTTERSPTFCIPPFKKWDDPDASESWAYLFTPGETTPEAWERLLKREPRTVEWTLEQLREMVGPEDAERQHEVIKRISMQEMYRFKIGMDGIRHRLPRPGDSAIGVVWEDAEYLQFVREGFVRNGLLGAYDAGARIGLILLSFAAPYNNSDLVDYLKQRIGCTSVSLPIPPNVYLLNGPFHIAVKMLLNALSTCIMVRLGRVMGNCMIYVVPSNLKLIDRATRYVSRLADLSYEEACSLLFDVIEYVEPRMKSDRAYPPVVGMAVIRAKQDIDNEEAEKRLNAN